MKTETAIVPSHCRHWPKDDNSAKAAIETDNTTPDAYLISKNVLSSWCHGKIYVTTRTLLRSRSELPRDLTIKMSSADIFEWNPTDGSREESMSSYLLRLRSLPRRAQYLLLPIALRVLSEYCFYLMQASRWKELWNVVCEKYTKYLVTNGAFDVFDPTCALGRSIALMLPEQPRKVPMPPLD